MSLKRKLSLLGLSGAVLLMSANAFAGTIGPVTLTGTNSDSVKANLGDGTHVLDVTGVKGSGDAYAKRVVALWPDETVANVSVSAGLDGTDSFRAYKYSPEDDGIYQSYYINWRGTSKSEVEAEIRH